VKNELMAFKSGDQGAFSRIYAAFRLPIVRFMFQRTNDHAVAEELAQDVFLKAYRARCSFDLRLDVAPWIWAIAKNTIVDWIRKRRSVKDAHQSDEVTDVQELPCALPIADIVIVAKEDRRGFFRLLGCLSRLQKKVLLMRVVHGLSYESIAARLNLSLSAVKCLMYRARTTLKESLMREEDHSSNILLS